MRKVRAVVYRKCGEPSSVLEEDGVPRPDPQPGQLAVRTGFAPIHHHDLAKIRGFGDAALSAPVVPGTEAMGVVIGARGIKNFREGDRVAVPRANGTWAEEFVVDAGQARKIVDAIDDQTASQLYAMPINAFLVMHELALKPGQWMIQSGANGAIGRAIISLAREREVGTINIVRSDHGFEGLRRVGAITIRSDRPDWLGKVAETGKQAQLAAALDVVGGEFSDALAGTLPPGGTLYLLGSLRREMIRIDPRRMIYGGLAVRGVWGSAIASRLDPRTYRGFFDEIDARFADGRFSAETAGTFAFSAAGDAAMLAESKARNGKVLLSPGM